MGRSFDLFLERVGFTGLWKRFGTLRGHFGVDLGVNLVVSGSVLATLGSSEVPKRGRVKKVTETVVRGSFVGPPPGPLLEAKLSKNR